MAKLAKWKKEYGDRLESMSNEDLLDAVIYAQIADGWDGYFSNRALWRSQESEKQLRERLKDWLKE